jgi:hypothetical protein
VFRRRSPHPTLNRKYLVKATGIVLMLAAMGCSLIPPQATSVPTSNPYRLSTYAARTVAAVLTADAPRDLTRTALAPSATPEPPGTPAIPTANFNPAVIITVMPTQSATPPYAVGTVCDKAEFVKDITVPDNTNYPPGTGFVKTWRLRNAGTCAWTSGYRLVYDSGSAMGGYPSINLPTVVQPGGTLDVSVNLRSPEEAKSYQGNWMLQNAQGVKFGVGLNGDKPFWVRIKVVPPFFAVTGASTAVDNPSYTGPCPHTFNFVASLTTTTAGVVTYRWERSDNQEDTLKSIQFMEPGTDTVTTTWSVGTPGKPGSRFSGWVRVYIEVPNHQPFGQAEFVMICTN